VAGRRGTAVPAGRTRSQPVCTEPVAHERPPRAPKSLGELGPGRSWRPPLLPLRLMAPVLAVSTVAVLTSGVLLLAAGHKSGLLLTVHKLSFIVFGVLFAVHLLAYLPRVVRSLRGDWATARRRAVPGAGARAMLVAAAAGGGAALALALLPSIQAYLGH
jgi:hypothetical protein